MSGHQSLFSVGILSALLSRTAHGSVDGFIKIAHGDPVSVFSDSQNGCFIENVLQICTGESRCSGSQGSQINIIFKTLVSGMYFQNGLSAVFVRQVYRNLTVETARS